jgi:ubiquinone/menaquinone biosynthesis C-methylase UbiE
MAHGHDIDRFNRWAPTYDQHWMQRRLFGPIQRTVLEMAADQPDLPAAILDVGCGTGQLLRAAEARFPGARLEGVDPAVEMVNHAASRSGGGALRFQQAAAEALPFPDAQFDLVFSTMTFHHWRDQRKGSAEVARVLAPGGRWLLAEFISTGPVTLARKLLRLHQFPGRPVLDGLLSEAGLAVIKRRKVGGLGGQVSVLAIAHSPAETRRGA